MSETCIRNNKPESWGKKLMRQSKEIEQHWTGTSNFEICSCVILSSYDQSLNQF